MPTEPDASGVAADAPTSSPRAVPPPTARAIVAGAVLAIVLCGVNSYLTLSFGVIEEGPTIAALFFFAFFFLSRTAITSSEMVIVATMGSAGGSLGFISNFFASRAMVGDPMTFWEMASFGAISSILGMAFVVPLRELLIVRETLPWPGSRATEGVIRALVEHGDPKQPRYLAATILFAMAAVIANDDGGFGLLPAETVFDVAGLAALGAGIAWAPFALGGAYFMGLRTCVGFLVGGLLLFTLAPYAANPAAPHRYVWPGIGFLVASGLTGLALNGRVVWAALASLVSLGRAGGRHEGDDAPVVSPKVFAGFVVAGVVLTAAYGWFAEGLNVVVIVLLVVVGGLIQNVIATRAAAETAFNPARVMGILLQGVSAAAGAAGAGANLVGAGVVAGSGAQAGNLTGDMAYGRWFHVPARWQFWTQLVTIVPCALVSAAVFAQIQATQPLSLEGAGLPAPVAKMWAASALVFAGDSPLPATAVPHLAIAAVIGVVYVLLEKLPRVGEWLPSSTGIGLGLVLPSSFDFAFFFGGVVFILFLERTLKVRPLTLTTIAVGCIVAEGLGGVAKPFLAIAGVLPG